MKIIAVTLVLKTLLTPVGGECVDLSAIKRPCIVWNESKCSENPGCKWENEACIFQVDCSLITDSAFCNRYGCSWLHDSSWRSSGGSGSDTDDYGSSSSGLEIGVAAAITAFVVGITFIRIRRRQMQSLTRGRNELLSTIGRQPPDYQEHHHQDSTNTKSISSESEEMDDVEAPFVASVSLEPSPSNTLLTMMASGQDNDRFDATKNTTPMVHAPPACGNNETSGSGSLKGDSRGELGTKRKEETLKTTKKRRTKEKHRQGGKAACSGRPTSETTKAPKKNSKRSPKNPDDTISNAPVGDVSVPPVTPEIEIVKKKINENVVEVTELLNGKIRSQRLRPYLPGEE